MSHRHFRHFAGYYWECEGTALRHFAWDPSFAEQLRVKEQLLLSVQRPQASETP